MQVVTGPLDYLTDWAAKRLRGVEGFDNPAAIGICRNNKLTAVAVYTGLITWEGGGNCEISFAADNPRWATRQALSVVLGTPFRVFGCSRITALIRKSHKRSRKLVEGIGFKREGAIRKGAPDGSTLIVYGLLREDFEEGKYG